MYCLCEFYQPKEFKITRTSSESMGFQKQVSRIKELELCSRKRNDLILVSYQSLLPLHKITVKSPITCRKVRTRMLFFRLKSSIWIKTFCNTLVNMQNTYKNLVSMNKFYLHRILEFQTKDSYSSSLFGLVLLKV